jgi:hypothetical protein
VTFLLRLASVAMLIFGAGHALGGTNSWSPPGDTPVLQSMRSFRFDVMGVTRTYVDFYLGFGHYITILLVLQSVVLWQLGTIAKTNASLTRPIIAAMLAATVAGALVSWNYIFLVPVVFSGVIAVILAIALFAS